MRVRVPSLRRRDGGAPAGRRDRGDPTPAWRAFAMWLGVALLVAPIVLVADERASLETVAADAADQVDPGSASGPGRGGTGDGSGGAVRAGAGGSGTASALACAAGRNGGATDVGVTADSIKLGSTVVDSGVGASFLRDARYGMLAVVNKVNAEGGVCGRRLDLSLVDDGWDFERGGRYLRNLVEDAKVFALLVVPSSEGLKNVSDAGYLRAKRVPVVGSDGMLIHQYTDPYIWPVAASTMSTMHIMVEHAAESFKAGRFAIVYERDYHFGIEGAHAFNEAVKEVTGSNIPGFSNPLTSPKCEKRFCGIKSGEQTYQTQIQVFNSACEEEPRCDFIALLLEPATALTWIGGGGTMQGRVGGPQPLFTRDFAVSCGRRCDGMWLWTGYEPPIGGNLGRPAIDAYVRDIKRTSPVADFSSSFVQGAYIGSLLMVEALRAVGPNLTREALAQTLDGLTLETGLAKTLRWRKGSHFANTRMRAFSIQFTDRFVGWKDERVAVDDPWVGGVGR